MQFKGLLIWLFTGALAAIGLAWLVAQIHLSGHAPVGLVSLGAGVLLGFVVSRLAANLGVGCRWRLTIGTALLAILFVLAEHGWLYRDFRRQWQEARTTSATVALLRPETPPSPAEYFAHEWNPGLWISDAVIIVGATLAVVLVLRRKNAF
ncbi:MAG TPA: hypothetical protein VHU84_18600 [Lacipirellulaceae bacterium]|jgi:hypothetical protein|nr:hypothetical protein [Lacipirellulaceae bacterium]